MNRKQMIEKAARRLRGYLQGHVPNGAWDEYADDVVDALLPQVSTIEELEALPKALLITTPAVGFLPAPLWWLGGELRFDDLRTVTEEEFRNYLRCGPLTVVWQP